MPTLSADHEYRGQTVKITNGPLRGIEEGTYVAHGHHSGWSCFYTAEGFMSVGDQGVYPTSAEAVAELHKLIDMDLLEEAAADQRRIFQPQVVHHVLTQDTAHGGHRIQSPATSLKVEVPLLLVLDLFNSLDVNDCRRELLRKALMECDDAESLILGSDGLSICYDEARNIARIQRMKQERRANQIGRNLQQLARDLQSLLGMAEEERQAKLEFIQDSIPLVAPKEASAKVRALGTVEPSLLNLLSPIAAAAFSHEQAGVVNAPSAIPLPNQ